MASTNRFMRNIVIFALVTRLSELVCSQQLRSWTMGTSGGSKAPRLVLGGEHQLACSHQRNLANLRERKRMMLINKGFELLKSRLPLRDLQDNKTLDRRGKTKCRLTKVDILKLTIDYIRQLSTALNGDTFLNTSRLSIDKLARRRLVRCNGPNKIQTTRRPKDDISIVNDDAKIKPKTNRQLVVVCDFIDNGRVSKKRFVLSWSKKNSEDTSSRRDMLKYRVWIPEMAF